MKKYSRSQGILYALIILPFMGGLFGCSPLSPNIQIENKKPKEIIIEKISDDDFSNVPPLLESELENDLCPYFENDKTYHLNTGDEINIIISGENDLSGDYTIQNSGNIKLSLIGDIHLSGCTLKQAEKLLFNKYSEGYLINPNISATLNKQKERL